MLQYFLVPYADQFQFFNLFRYITFRTGGAIMTALDGYPMARQGLGGVALSISAWQRLRGSLVATVGTVRSNAESVATARARSAAATRT